MMTKQDDDMQVFAGQLVAQDMLIQILMGQIVQSMPDRGASVRDALVQGTQAIRSNPNMTQREKFGCEKTLEDAIDTIDQLRAKAGWTK